MAAPDEIELLDKQELDAESEPTRPGPVYVPAVDIFEDPDGLTVVADVPGATDEGIEIDLDDKTLTISADVIDGQGEEEHEVVREWAPGRYYRQFTISDRIDRDRIDATLNDGVLRLRLPKIEQARPRKITVSSG